MNSYFSRMYSRVSRFVGMIAIFDSVAEASKKNPQKTKTTLRKPEDVLLMHNNEPKRRSNHGSNAIV